MIQNAHTANKKLVREGYADFIKELVKQKNELCIDWRDKFDEEFKVFSRILWVEPAGPASVNVMVHGSLILSTID